ncbi:MAG: flagellar assembly factor FliW [Phycisphaerales bacterium]|nr:MAG: flagellar assembly factor FliW [Phycisphaerales bacterium]
MHVKTTRFGVVEIADDKVITFPQGLLGFPDHRRYCLLEPGEDACFFWLQSIDEPALAFVVTDPALFFKDYQVPIRPEQAKALDIDKLEDAQVFVIVNKVGQTLTANLQGPLLINTLNLTGQQLVLADKRWTTRHTLMQVGTDARQAATA